MIERALAILRERKTSFIHEAPEKDCRELLAEIFPRIIEYRNRDAVLEGINGRMRRYGILGR